MYGTLKNAFFCRSVDTEMPPTAMSHLPDTISGIRLDQLVLTHAGLTPRLAVNDAIKSTSMPSNTPSGVWKLNGL